VYGWELGAAVEDDECAGVEAEPVEIPIELLQALVKRVGSPLVVDFEFEGFPLLGGLAVGVGVRPADEQVDPAAPDAVLAVDVAATVGVGDLDRASAADQARSHAGGQSSVVSLTWATICVGLTNSSAMTSRTADSDV
jgi:hypothetical protein